MAVDTFLLPSNGARGAKVVALGGGHGLYTSLTALKYLTRNVTAVVTVADDGGSSGRLRQEIGGLPPGDLRMALSALCDDSEWGQTWRDVLQYRFQTNGPLDGHALGNLLIEGLWELLGDSGAGLDWVGKLLDVKGRVIPMAAQPLSIEADVLDYSESTAAGPSADTDTGSDGVAQVQKISTLYGQNRVAKAHGLIQHVRLIPPNPQARPEALEAIEQADWVIFGPGSWYTSVIPHLLVPQLREALEATAARRMLVLNLQADAETEQLDAAGHVRSFHSFAPDLRLDTVLVDPGPVVQWESLRAAAALCGATLMAHPVADNRLPGRHDALFLAGAYRRAFMELAPRR